MSEHEIEIQTTDGTMPTFIAHPDGAGPWPVALLFMDGIGYREQIRENARRFAAAGYLVAAPDLFYRHGRDVRIDMSSFGKPDSPEAKRAMEIIGSLTPGGVESDIESVLAAVRESGHGDTSSLVCVGYCMGARHALHIAAVRNEVTAAALIHPGALPTDELGSVSGELYVAFAETDRTATPEAVAAFREEMQRGGVRGTVERVPAAHGFSMADLPVFDREQSERHFTQTLELWRRNGTAVPA